MRTSLTTPLALIAVLAGCSLGNDTLLVATLLESPAAPPAVVGSPPPQVAVAQVFLGQVDTDLTRPPSQSSMTPISGATVKLLRDGAEVATLAETPAGSGYYQATATGLYQAGATFRFVAQVGPDQYWGEVAGAPAAPAPTVNGLDIAPYGNYGAIPPTSTLGRPGCANICDIGIYGVWPVSNGVSFDGGASPSCTNLPQEAGGIVNLAFLDDSAWRVQSFTLAKSPCFPPLTAYPGGYVVGLANVKKGTTSGNTSAFSAAMVGTSGAAGVTVAAQ